MLYLAACTHIRAIVCLHAAHIAALWEFWTDWLPTETRAYDTVDPRLAGHTGNACTLMAYLSTDLVVPSALPLDPSSLESFMGNILVKHKVFDRYLHQNTGFAHTIDWVQ